MNVELTLRFLLQRKRGFSRKSWSKWGKCFERTANLASSKPTSISFTTNGSEGRKNRGKSAIMRPSNSTEPCLRHPNWQVAICTNWRMITSAHTEYQSPTMTSPLQRPFRDRKKEKSSKFILNKVPLRKPAQNWTKSSEFISNGVYHLWNTLSRNVSS